MQTESHNSEDGKKAFVQLVAEANFATRKEADSTAGEDEVFERADRLAAEATPDSGEQRGEERRSSISW